MRVIYVLAGGQVVNVHELGVKPLRTGQLGLDLTVRHDAARIQIH